MTPLEYARAIVLPTLQEALLGRDDRRRVYLACIVVFHLADYIAAADSEAEPGFAGGDKNARRAIAEGKRKLLFAAMKHRCPVAFDVVEGIANGMKHPERPSLLPGSEREVPMFEWGSDEPIENTRWEGPGLAVFPGGQEVYLDDCAQDVLAAFVAERPDHLGDLDLAGFIPWV